MRDKASSERQESGELLSMSAEMKQQIERIAQPERAIADGAELEVITYQDGDETRIPELHCGWKKATKCL